MRRLANQPTTMCTLFIHRLLMEFYTKDEIRWKRRRVGGGSTPWMEIKQIKFVSDFFILQR